MASNPNQDLLVVLASHLEQTGQSFIRHGLSPSEFGVQIATFLGYMIGNGAPTAQDLADSLGVIGQLIHEVASEVFLGRQSNADGGSA